MCRWSQCLRLERSICRRSFVIVQIWHLIVKIPQRGKSKSWMQFQVQFLRLSASAVRFSAFSNFRQQAASGTYHRPKPQTKHFNYGGTLAGSRSRLRRRQHWALSVERWALSFAELYSGWKVVGCNSIQIINWANRNFEKFSCMEEIGMQVGGLSAFLLSPPQGQSGIAGGIALLPAPTLSLGWKG